MHKPTQTLTSRISKAGRADDITEWFSNPGTYLSDFLAETDISKECDIKTILAEYGLRRNHTQG
jgi:hypothetical protein